MQFENMEAFGHKFQLLCQIPHGVFREILTHLNIKKINIFEEIANLDVRNFTEIWVFFPIFTQQGFGSIG